MGTGKIDLNVAQRIANQLVDHVRSAMDRVEIAGSVRRQKPVVGDIELVGIPADQEKLISLLRDVGQTIKPGTPDVVPWSPKLGSKYIRVRLNEGMNLDFFVANPLNWGGLYLMRTGSASGPDGNAFNGFVPGMFSRFKKLSGGGRMTDCMPTTTAGEQIPLREESDFFDLLEMNFVPPVERTGRSVIKKYVR
jgi:DNA polymerase/3'-5' exonuclease PolX